MNAVRQVEGPDNEMSSGFIVSSKDVLYYFVSIWYVFLISLHP